MDIKYIKRTPFSVKARKRYTRFRFSPDERCGKGVLGSCGFNNCEFTDEGVQCVPEWAPVYNQNGVQYKCNITNPLEVGSWKVSHEDTDGYQDWYYVASVAGGFFTYKEDKGMFYTVATGLNRMTVQPLMGEGYTYYAVFGKEQFLLVEPSGHYITVFDEDVVSAGAYFRHRVFVGMKGGVLRYSAPEDFTEFSESVEESGSIRLANNGGEIIAIKVYNDALYVFFQSGITRLEIGGDPSEFYAEKIDYFGGDIFTRTICVCDHAIYFMAQGGIYRLKSKTPERVDVGVLLPNRTSGMEGCAIWKGMPLFRYKQLDGIFKTLALRADGGAYYMPDLAGLSQAENGKVLFVDGQKKLYHLVEPGNGLIWPSGYFNTVMTNLGYNGRKTLRNIRLYGEGEVEVGLISERRSFSKWLYFQNGTLEWKVCEPGEEFGFYFTLGRQSKLKEMVVEFETVTSYKEGNG